MDKLNRFITAQSKGVYDAALAELVAGKKRGHWIWFIFPQIKGLSHSKASVHFGIADRDEASAYIEDSVLGARLVECTNTMLSLQGLSARQILAYPDHLKFQSCMTLFAAVTNETSIFNQALDKYFDSETDEMTLKLLRAL